jgi:glutathione S-transferase
VIELYYGPGACSCVPHVGLEAVREATGTDFVARRMNLADGDQRKPEYLAMNPHAQVPLLVVDGKPLAQVIAICDWIDRTFPQAALLPADSWQRAQAMSTLAWINNTVHPTFTRILRAPRFARAETAQADVRETAVQSFRELLERLQAIAAGASPFLFGERLSFPDVYAFVVLRWAGRAGIDPDSLPALRAYVGRVMQAPPVAAVMAREEIAMDTYKKG